MIFDIGDKKCDEPPGNVIDYFEALATIHITCATSVTRRNANYPLAFRMPSPCTAPAMTKAYLL